MHIKSVIYVESMLSILIESIEIIDRLELLAELRPSFDTIYAKKKRMRHYNDAVNYLIKSELVIELAYEYVINEEHESKMLFKMLEDKYLKYSSIALYLIYLHNKLLKKGFPLSQLTNYGSTIFHN